MPATATKAKASEAYRTISEVAEDLDLPQHVLRFWETRFTQIKPMKRGGGRRYYRPEDVDLIKGIRTFLYGEGYTIRGLQKIIKETGAAHIMAVGRGEKSIDQIEKPKGPEIIEVHSDVIRTRTRFETGDEKSDSGEQPSFARHLIDTLSQKIDEQKIHKQEAPPYIKEPIMEQVKPLPVIPNYSLRTSYSTQPLEIPPLTSAVSHGRGLTKPMTKDPSPLVKFRPIEELPDELPAFVNARKPNQPIEPARHEPVFSLSSARETRVFEPKIAQAQSQNLHNRLQSALYELSECKRLLSAAF